MPKPLTEEEKKIQAMAEKKPEGIYGAALETPQVMVVKTPETSPMASPPPSPKHPTPSDSDGESNS